MAKKAAKKKARRKQKPVQHFTAHARAKFLTLLRDTGNVTHSARQVGVTRMTAYHHRDRDAEFAQLWDDALHEAVDGLEHEAHRRAVQGVEEPVFQGGRQVGTIRRYSDTLLLSLLKAHAPEKYRDRQSIEHAGPGGGPITYVADAPAQSKLDDWEKRHGGGGADADRDAD